MAGKEETTGDEEPEVSLAGTEELPGTEPPPASVDEIGGGIQEASLLEAGGPIEEDEAPIGEDESLPAGAEEVPGPAIPDAPISFEEKEFPGAEAAEAEPEEFQEPVFMPGEVAPGQEDVRFRSAYRPDRRPTCRRCKYRSKRSEKEPEETRTPRYDAS